MVSIGAGWYLKNGLNFNPAEGRFHLADTICPKYGTRSDPNIGILQDGTSEPLDFSVVSSHDICLTMLGYAVAGYYNIIYVAACKGDAAQHTIHNLSERPRARFSAQKA